MKLCILQGTSVYSLLNLNAQEQCFKGWYARVSLLHFWDWMISVRMLLPLPDIMHIFCREKYPHAEIAFSCPRLRPIINNDRINPMDVHEPQLLQVVCAYRLFMPFASITVSTRECERVRDNLVGIAATKISAGVSTESGSHVGGYRR